MKTQITRFAATAALSVSAFTSIVPFASSAHAIAAGDLADWQSNYGTSAVTAGDTNGDGDVDARDFLVWQKFATTDGPSDFPGFGGGVRVAVGDVNDDGAVDGRDFLVWQRQ